jgi:hypothetical protein
MSSNRLRALAVPVCAALLCMSACTRSAPDQMAWARAALERNASIEIVATDPQTRSFTVRDKASGELRMVRADELIAGAAPAAAPPAAAQNEPPAAPASAPGATTAPAPPAAAASSWRSDQNDSTAAPQAEAAASAPPARAPAVAEGSGRVLESGPGYSIKTATPEPIPGGRAAPAGISSAAVERRHDPIVCQGARLLQIDNRNLVFDGDAVSAQDGCEIHITNSRISASGIGVTARAASVYLDNSQIEGDAGSIDASEGAQVYAASSRFRGLSRRLDTATFHDLGGNVWN